jgi:hypothetical protein
MRDVMQGTFQWDWVHANLAGTQRLAGKQNTGETPSPRTTKAAEGHRSAADRRRATQMWTRSGTNDVTLAQPTTAPEPFKLSKFKRVPARNITFRKQSH